MFFCLSKNHAMETYGGNAGTNPRIAQHQRPGHPLSRKLILHNSFKLLFYLIFIYLFITPFSVMLFDNFFCWRNSPQWARTSSMSRLCDHTQTHHTLYDFSRRAISSTRRPVPDNTQHSQQTDFHAPGGIQTLSPSKRAGADPRLCPRGYQYRCLSLYVNK